MDMFETERQSAAWDDWHWQLAQALRSPSEIAQAIGMSPQEARILDAVAERYPVLVTPYYLSLAGAVSRQDPILRQCLPDPAELEDGGGCPDPLAEERDSPLEGLVHRYPDRVLVVSSNHCALHCRHCMRKRYWGESRSLSTEHLARLCAYVASHSEIREVILSGGDPLLLSDDALSHILGSFLRIPHVDLVRLGSRVPVVLPQRVTPALCAMLSRHRQVWLATHFNHPLELTERVAVAGRDLLRAGVPLVNQTVLLKGVNDDPDTLAALFSGLLRLGIKPYYLFHGDPVQGTMHFRTGVGRGLELMSELRRRLSGLALPAFAVDLPAGRGKVRLEPPCGSGVDDAGMPVYTDENGRRQSYPDA